jgi:branched-chain amino acid transport system ATP-binding protein
MGRYIGFGYPIASPRGIREAEGILTAMTDVILSFQNLSIGFGGNTVIDNASFEGSRGKIYGLSGPNGSGKTSLLNALCGVIKPSVATIEFYGKTPRSHTPYDICRLGQGLFRAFQVPLLVEDLSLLENLLIIRWPKSMVYSFSHRSYPTDLVREAQHFLDCVGLEHKRDEPAQHLSYGQKRRVNLAMAMFSRAGILLLDEPFANLDPQITAVCQKQLVKCARDDNRMVILVDHQQERLLNFADFILRIVPPNLFIGETDSVSVNSTNRLEWESPC